MNEHEQHEQRACAHCGATFTANKVGNPRLYCSAKCRDAAKNVKKTAIRREKRAMPRTCAKCGATFVAKFETGRVSPFCDKCRLENYRAMRREWHRELRAKNPKMATCDICGVTFRKTSVSTVCPACRQARKAEKSARGRGRPRKCDEVGLNYTTCIDSECTLAEQAEVMRVVRFVPEAKRWPITKNWPSRMREMLRDIYLGIHEMR